MKTCYPQNRLETTPDDLIHLDNLISRTELQTPADIKTAITFDDVDDLIADDIMAFWRTHAGVTAFYWTPKWAQTPIRVICGKWHRGIAGEGLSSLSARFEQVFEP